MGSPCHQAGFDFRTKVFFLIGSFSNDDGDDNENVKKAISFSENQTTTLPVHYTFGTFLCRHCT